MNAPVSATGASRSAPILAVRDLTRRFSGLVALHDVGFDVHSGEIVGVIGPNGAGKTTLVSMISGTLAPSAGEVRFHGDRIDSWPAWQRARAGIARTFQIMKPFPALTVLDNVAVGALFGASNLRTLRLARESAYECLTRVGLGTRATQRADELGGPERKRLELAKALAMKPALLLLDEVMAGLNHVEIDEIIGVIGDLREQGIGIVVVEHVMKAIRSLSDRVVVLHHGALIAQGSAADVLADARVIDAYLGQARR
jgi:branched-chain amino acid transport system ATP-binding protein